MNVPKENIIIEIVDRPRPRWYVNFADFANMVKAFIGSNYLYVAYAFSQSGLWLGIVSMLIIAFLTDHCCHLIVKTKHHGIGQIIEKRRSGMPYNRPGKHSTYRSNNTTSRSDSGVDDEDTVAESDPCFEVSPNAQTTDSDSEDDSDYAVVTHSDMEHIIKNTSYGDVGQLAFGSVGVGVVNFCIALTQFGFCVNYFIFIGNTVHSLFPVNLCYTEEKNHTRICETLSDLNAKNSNLSFPLPVSLAKRDYATDYSTVLPNITTLLPDISTVLPNITTLLPDISTVLPNITTLLPNISTVLPNISTLVPNTTLTPNTTSVPMTNLTVPMSLIWDLEFTAPDLKLFVASPVLIFILFALIRNVRYLGVISVIANISILFGCVSVTIFILIGFKVHESIVYFRIEGFPLFFGMVTGAFEGIGLVIPVESSMVGNRHLFSMFLHGAILFLTIVLGFFGVLGYLRYGTDVHQMLNKNLPPGNPISMAVNIGICLGILLTFPLQIFPVIEILESYLFCEGRIFGPSKQAKTSEEESLMPAENDTAPLLEDEHVVTHVPDSVAAWKRNILRVFIVMVACALAIILKDNFAYVGAFVGAVGSSVLAFILPCLLHLRLCWRDLHVLIKVKDIVIIVFGVLASIISVVSVVDRIMSNMDV